MSWTRSGPWGVHYREELFVCYESKSFLEVTITHGPMSSFVVSLQGCHLLPNLVFNCFDGAGGGWFLCTYYAVDCLDWSQFLWRVVLVTLEWKGQGFDLGANVWRAPCNFDILRSSTLIPPLSFLALWVRRHPCQGCKSCYFSLSIDFWLGSPMGQLEGWSYPEQLLCLAPLVLSLP